MSLKCEKALKSLKGDKKKLIKTHKKEEKCLNELQTAYEEKFLTVLDTE